MKLGGYLVINLNTVKFADLKANSHSAVLITSVTVDGIVYHDVFGTYISNGDGYLITAIVGTQMLSCQITSTDTKTIKLSDIGGSTPIVNNDYITVDYSTEQSDPATLFTRLVNNSDKLVIVKNISGYEVSCFIGPVKLNSDNTEATITGLAYDGTTYTLESTTSTVQITSETETEQYVDVTGMFDEMGITGELDPATTYTLSLSSQYASVMQTLLNVRTMSLKIGLRSNDYIMYLNYNDTNKIYIGHVIKLNSVTSNYSGSSTANITYMISTISYEGYIGNLQLKFYQDSSGYHMEVSIL